MKKIVLISLFGLFAAHESSAMLERAAKTASHESSTMFARAAKTASPLAPPLGLLTGRFKAAGLLFMSWEKKHLQKRFFALKPSERSSLIIQQLDDFSEKEAKQFLKEYDEWIFKYSNRHKLFTDIIRSLQRWKGFEERDLELLPREDEPRMPTDEEKNCCKRMLMKYGYDEDKALKISEKILVVKSCTGSYCTFSANKKECILLPQIDLDSIANQDPKGELTLMHEAEHYTYSLGHHHNSVGYERFREEVRAEIESMRKMAKNKDSLLFYHLQLVDDKLDDASRDTRRELISEGYVTNSNAVRNLIEREAAHGKCQNATKSAERA